MNKLKSPLLTVTAAIASCLMLNGCSSSSGGDMEILDTDQFTGTLIVGTDRAGKPNWEGGLAQARIVCKKWGYAEAVWKSRSAASSRVAQCTGGGAEKGRK